jgi:hypothetical protein
MTQSASVEVVREFCQLMSGNDFYAVAAVLAPEFMLEWPQSRDEFVVPSASLA